MTTATEPDAAWIAKCLREREPRAGFTRVLAIDGRTGAGKSTFSDAAARLLDAPTVRLEELYGGWDGLSDGITRLVADVLLPLAAGGSAWVPRYDWNERLWRAPLLLDSPDSLVVEGVGAGALAAAPFVSLTVWIEADADLRRRRAFARDGELFERHWERWAAQEERYVADDHPAERADVVLHAPSIDAG